MRYLLLLGLVLSGISHAGSTLRCGSQLISLDDYASEILHKCGEPSQREFLGYREQSQHYGYFSASEQVPLEEWVYGPRNGMYHFLRLEGGQLKRIQSRRRQ